MNAEPTSRRPLLYLVVAGVLALGSLLIPSGGPDMMAAQPPASSAPSGGGGGPTACDTIVGSLRPTGPLPAPGAMPTGSPMAAIVERGRLIVGVDQGKFHLGYRDPVTTQLKGSDIDVAKLVAAAIFGGRPDEQQDRMQFVVLDIADRAQAVVDKRVDMVVNSFTVTCARQQQVEFSTAYMEVTQTLLVPKASGVREVEDLSGQKVCTSDGSTTEDVLRAQPAGLDVVTLPGIPDCVVELQAGRVAAVSSDNIILGGLAAQDPQTEVVGRDLDPAAATIAIAMSKDQQDLVRFVNAVLERARADGSLAQTYRYWFEGLVRPVPVPAEATYQD